MLVICKRCDKEFKLFEKTKDSYLKDELCGRCRGRKRYLETVNESRKTKECPICKKKILKTSKFCKSCGQLGDKNNHYVDGHASSERVCKVCGKKISSGSSKGKCSKCYTKTLFGKGNPNYRYGHFLREFYNSGKYKHWKLSVFDRDKRICQVCKTNNKSNGFQAHHIFPKRDFPELVYSIDNGITLCKTCHESISKNEHEYIEYFLKIIRPNENSVNSVNPEMGIPNQVI